MTSESTDHSFEDALRLLAEGQLSAEKLAERPVIEPRMKSFVTLAALLALDRIDDFETQMFLELERGLAASEILELLLEMADLGIRVSPHAYELVRVHMT
jgi:alkylhydroperoxidase/carboxymuconolactone decarboxylase family protein YurZ